MNTPSHIQPTLQNLDTKTVFVLGETTIIGRHENCNLVLSAERGASRKHARITVENNVAVLMDLGSLNGTMVNGREIGRAVQLSDGDVIIFDEQEYRYTSSSAQTQSNGENVTVIANKDEIDHPENIKPAIRVVETATPDSDLTSFDETKSWDVPPTSASVSAKKAAQASAPEVERSHDNFDEAIPATSRPGGDAPTPHRLQNRQQHNNRTVAKKSVWSRWYVLLPLLILFMLVAFYFAYTAGFSAGNASGSS